MLQDGRFNTSPNDLAAYDIAQASNLQTASNSSGSESGPYFQLTGHHHASPGVDYMKADCAGSSCTRCDGLGTCQPCNNGCEPWWSHCSNVFGELLYLSPGNSDLIYAVEQTDTTNSASPTGPVGIANVDEAVGYRVGFSKRRSRCSSFNASYARWDADTLTSIEAMGNNVLRSHLIHPSTATVGSESLESSARQLVNFQVVDLSYRRVVRANDLSVINWSGGLRYGNLEQGLQGEQTVSVSTGLTTVNTDIDFDGFGILTGLDGERRSQCCGALIYGKLLGSLLAGNWTADYEQLNQFGGGRIATHFEDYRITPILDAELGFGWHSCNNRWKITTGYLFSNWFNTISNRDYIRNVRTGDLLDLTDVLTFSGLTFRTEFRF